MRTHRLAVFALVALGALALSGCYGRHDSAATDAPGVPSSPASVPAGGTAGLKNYRIYPFEYFSQAPLYQLFPQNGGFDKETNKPNIRQRMHIEVFGKTVAGKKG